MTTLAKTMLVLGCVGVCCSGVYAAGAGGTGDTASTAAIPPSDCLLSPIAFSDRVADVQVLLSRQEEVRELEDGYAFRFPGDDGDLAAQLAAWMVAERECCAFLGFELTFAPEQGPIWLSVSGSQEVKTLMETLIRFHVETGEGSHR